MPKKTRPQFGELSPQHHFMINPYPDMRLSTCPVCEQKTGQRKRPLVIHIHPGQLIFLNYTCRYCKACDLLIAHKHEIEHLLTEQMRVTAPNLIGNAYFIIGTMERKAWQENMTKPKLPKEILAYIADFDTVYEELRVTQTGWFPADFEPGLRNPPPSKEWVRN